MSHTMLFIRMTFKHFIFRPSFFLFFILFIPSYVFCYLACNYRTNRISSERTFIDNFVFHWNNFGWWWRIKNRITWPVCDAIARNDHKLLSFDTWNYFMRSNNMLLRITVKWEEKRFIQVLQRRERRTLRRCTKNNSFRMMRWTRMVGSAQLYTVWYSGRRTEILIGIRTCGKNLRSTNACNHSEMLGRLCYYFFRSKDNQRLTASSSGLSTRQIFERIKWRFY